MDPQAAIDQPRFVVETEAAGRPLGAVRIESDGVDAATVAALESRGHRVPLIEPNAPVAGWAQMIRRRSDGSYEAGADPRADSRAAGI